MYITLLLKPLLFAALILTSVANPINIKSVDFEENVGLLGTRADTGGKGSASNIKVATKAECKAQMKVEPSTTLFYSVVRSQVARDTIASSKYPYLKGYMTLRSRWKDPKWPDQFTIGVSEASAKNFWDTASEALAEMSSGTAYVLLPKGKGTDWKKGTVWDRVEWPNLPKGLKVIRINPDDPSEQEVIRAG